MSFSHRSANPPERVRGSLVGPRRVKPVVGKYMSSLREAIEGLQRDSQDQLYFEQESVQSFQYLCSQVNALQRGFSTLADAVLEELDAIREEQIRSKEDRAMWADMMQKMQNDVRDKMAELSVLQSENSAAAFRSQSLELANLRADRDNFQKQANMMEDRLSDFQASLQDFQMEVSQVGSQCRELSASVSDCTRKVDVTDRKLTAVQTEAENVDMRLQDENDKTRRESSEAAAALARDAAALAEDARAMRQWCKQLESNHETRLKKLETTGAADLSQKTQAVLQQQARHSKSVEALMKSVVQDHQGLQKQARTLDSTVATLKRCVAEHHEGIMRVSSVFSHNLQCHSPITASVNLPSSLALLEGLHALA